MRDEDHDQSVASSEWTELRDLRRMSDQDSEHEDESFDKLNRWTVFKLDCILLPFLSLLFCLNHLDKTNIGNAETAGFSHDAGLQPGDINTAMAFFFAFFVALQPVGAALGRVVGMARWVPACMSLWGICTLLHIWVRSRWQLVLLRIVIATLEAGFYPTTVGYLSLFYTKYEFAVRLGFFYGQAAFSGALGGVLSWLVYSRMSQGEDALVKPWQVLFLVEGCITLVVAMIGFVWLPNAAGSAWFLSKAERRWATKRMVEVEVEHEDDQSDDDKDDTPRERLLGGQAPQAVVTDRGLRRQDVVAAFCQYKIWHLLVCNILSAIPATAFGIFLPIVIKQMSPDLNLSPAASNLLAVPPFVCGAVVLLAFTYWSDRARLRLMPILAGLVILLVGLTITVFTRSSLGWHYAGLCVLLSGSYIASPLTVAWISNNTPEPGKRAILLGINGWGNLAGVSSAFLFTPGDAASGYAVSFGVTLVCVAVAFVGYAAFMLLLRRENAARAARISGWPDRMKRREMMYGDVDGATRQGDSRLTYVYSY